MSHINETQPVIFGEVLFDNFEEDGSRVLGGAPFNVAWHLQGFGMNPLFISRVGDDISGRDVESAMREWGMDATGLQWDSVHPTGEVVIRLTDGQPSFDIISEQAYDYIDVDNIPPLTPSVLYHGSLGIRGDASSTSLKALIDRYHPQIFLDVNLRAPWWTKQTVFSLLEKTTWLKVNDNELHMLVEGGGSVEYKARTLLGQYPFELVIVTQGKAGAMAVSRRGDTHRVKPDGLVEVVDTVGAGDAFASVCLLGLTKQWPIPSILQRAQSFASMVVGQRGATLNDAGIYRQLNASWGN